MALSNYNVPGLFRLIRDLLYTKLFFRKSRLIRLPVYIRGERFIDFGNQLTTGVALRIDAFPYDKRKEKLITIGDRVQINDYVHIAARLRLTIGNDVLIASKVFITDHNHGKYSGDDQSSPHEAPAKRAEVSAPVSIEDNVWLGEYVTVLPGVTIGKGAIIGAMSVVNKDIPPYTIAVGAPAKVIKRYNESNGQWERVNE
jgi:lipopolysaccharide O-acetyltransferase